MVVRARFEIHEIVVLIVSAATHVNRFSGADLAIDVADGHVQLVTFGDDFVRELLVQLEALFGRVFTFATANQIVILIFLSKWFVSGVNHASFKMRTLVVVEPDRFIVLGMDLPDDDSAHMFLASCRGDIVDGKSRF